MENTWIDNDTVELEGLEIASYYVASIYHPDSNKIFEYRIIFNPNLYSKVYLGKVVASFPVFVQADAERILDSVLKHRDILIKDKGPFAKVVQEPVPYVEYRLGTKVYTLPKV